MIPTGYGWEPVRFVALQPLQGCFLNYYYKKRGMNVAVTSIAPIKEDWLMLGTAEGVLLFDAKRGCFLNDTLPATLHMLRPTVWYVRETLSILVPKMEFIPIPCQTAFWIN